MAAPVSNGMRRVKPAENEEHHENLEEARAVWPPTRGELTRNVTLRIGVRAGSGKQKQASNHGENVRAHAARLPARVGAARNASGERHLARHRHIAARNKIVSSERENQPAGKSRHR